MRPCLRIVIDENDSGILVSVYTKDNDELIRSEKAATIYRAMCIAAKFIEELAD